MTRRSRRHRLQWILAGTFFLGVGALVPRPGSAQEQLPPAPIVPYVGPVEPVPQTEPAPQPGDGATLLPPPFVVPVFPSPEAAGSAGAPQQEDE